MALSAADLGLELAVVAGPDELAEGIGYNPALPKAAVGIGGQSATSISWNNASQRNRSPP